MDPKIKRKWLAALRSGKYKQGKDRLYNGRAYCCLGVLCRVMGAKVTKDGEDRRFRWEGAESSMYLPDPLLLMVGLSRGAQDDLARMNDNGKSFKEIAKHIASSR